MKEASELMGMGKCAAERSGSKHVIGKEWLLTSGCSAASN